MIPIQTSRGVGNSDAGHSEAMARSSACSEPKAYRVSRRRSEESRSGTQAAVSSTFAPTTSGTSRARPAAKAPSGSRSSTRPSATGPKLAGRKTPVSKSSCTGPVERATRASRGCARRQSTASSGATPCASWLQPSARRWPAVRSSASSKLRWSQAPLWRRAAEMRPAVSGALSIRQVLAAPARSPKSSTRSGSPPKAAMLSWTQPRASWRSRMPRFIASGTARWPRKPSSPSRYWTVTTTLPVAAERAWPSASAPSASGPAAQPPSPAARASAAARA